MNEALMTFFTPPDGFWESCYETVYMTSATTLFAFIFGFLLATLMIVSGPHGLRPCRSVYAVLDFLVNLFRSMPFFILIILLLSTTRLVMGTFIGTTAAIFPLTVAATPFAARLIEGSLLEVDRGVVEAARSFGATNRQIIFKVMVPEALPSIVLNISILAITILGYSAMAGAVGGGGLGDLAYRGGFVRFETWVTYWCIVALFLIVLTIQQVGNFFYKTLR